MTTIYISLGSNIERDRHIRAGLDALHAEFGELRVSRVFESEAVGFNGRPFYNLVAAAETDLPLAELAPKLRHPVDGRTMGELWQAYDKASQQLCPIPFHWEACELQHH